MIQDRNEIAQRKSEIMEEAHQASMIEHKLRVREMEARAEHDQQMWALDIKIKLAQLALLKKQLGEE